MGINKRKGVSPVIATILMVMITVGLVAFSYSFFMGFGEKTVESTKEEFGKMKKGQQTFEIPTAYECNPDEICFEFRASSKNTLDMPANESFISLYVDNVPKSLKTWDGGISGTACKGNTAKLSPGESCYGKVDQTCDNGDTYTLKISHSWDIDRTYSITCK